MSCQLVEAVYVPSTGTNRTLHSPKHGLRSTTALLHKCLCLATACTHLRVWLSTAPLTLSAAVQAPHDCWPAYIRQRISIRQIMIRAMSRQTGVLERHNLWARHAPNAYAKRAPVRNLHVHGLAPTLLRMIGMARTAQVTRSHLIRQYYSLA